LAADLANHYRFNIESLTLIPSGGGRFEVIVDDELIFSKKALGRHAEAGEVAGILENKTGLTPYVEG
jgi:selenoprotein W-related protein